MIRHSICSHAGPLGRDVRRPEVPGFDIDLSIFEKADPMGLLDAILATRDRYRAESRERALAAARGVPFPGVCPHEDCPHPRQLGALDCGNHEEWMT